MAATQQRWTTGQVDALMRYGADGVDKCIEVIEGRYGVRRSRECVQKKASRLGISLCERATCPICGRTVRRLRETSGLCDVCHERAFTGPREEMARVMRESEYTKEEKDAIDDARRERNRNRQRAHREKTVKQSVKPQAEREGD